MSRVSNPYVDLCLHVQALRRQMEEARTPLAAAVGVAGSIYTHQVANVLRVLTDVRVRHLLADEVGLGKTVQALMILNALRRQRRDLRALVIVPDLVVSQWRDELMARAHTAPYETHGYSEGQYVRLAWPGQFLVKDGSEAPELALTDIDPSRYQVLIVDELHRLRADLQERIVRVSPSFEHMLILTATPAYQLPERHAQLFALLEPERTARARSEVAETNAGIGRKLSVGADLSKWPDWAAQQVVDALLERDNAAAALVDTDSLTATAMALCAYRRVIRTRRADYSGVLPRRRHRPIVVEPLGAEVERQTLMWRYFTHLDGLARQFDRVLFAKRVILSPPSLEQRVDFLRRKGHEREGLLERVKPLVRRSNGDSRADALVDLLADVWAQAPRERVLVAAQDVLTVDYLFDLVQARLPEIGPLEARVPLVAARVRQGMETKAVEDLSAFGHETSEHIEAFQRGRAQVLFAPETVQAGLNLQCARVLVLYSVPWRPEEVEQWIGRLDRIGNVAAFSSEGDAQTVDVYTIAQRGLVDEKVVTVLQRFQVFERSVNTDGDHLAEVAQLIEDAALRPAAVNWRALEDRAASMAAKDAAQELNSALRPHLPWGVRWAIRQRERLLSMPPAAPVIADLPEHTSFGPKAWDRALEAMLSLLERAGDYHLRANTDRETGQRFKSLWYRFGEGMVYGHKPVKARVVFTFGADPTRDRSPKHAHAFVTRRGHIGNPPRRDVTLEIDHERVRRPLRFVNFGDALHDELVDGWAQPQAALPALDVTYFDDHSLWKHAEPGWFLLRFTLLDPAAALTPPQTLAETESELAAAVTYSTSEQLQELVAPFSRAATCALEADVRWLRASLTAIPEMTARWRSPLGWRAVPADAIAALVNPMAHSLAGVPHAAKAVDIDATAMTERDHLRSSERVGGEMWGAKLPEFATELRARLRVVAAEAQDALDLVRRELARADEALGDAEERGNRAQVTRAEELRSAAMDTLAMTEAYWSKREGWLRECEASVGALRPSERLFAVIRALRGAT